MKTAEAKREITYQVTMEVARNWYEQGIITKGDYKLFEDAMQEKYTPVTDSLFTELGLQESKVYG